MNKKARRRLRDLEQRVALLELTQTAQLDHPEWQPSEPPNIDLDPTGPLIEPSPAPWHIPPEDEDEERAVDWYRWARQARQRRSPYL